MDILLLEEDDNAAYETFRFPGGEPHIKLKLPLLMAAQGVTIKVQKFDYELLAITVDALRRVSRTKPIGLALPYFPGARQDRVCAQGEALSAAVYARMINSLGFDHVTIMDPHSDVAPALLDHCKVIPHGRVYVGDRPIEILDYWIDDLVSGESCVVVAPDAGATKKVLAAIDRAHNKDRISFVQGSKKRSVIDGSLCGFGIDVDAIEPTDDVIIMDDINCNGGTFLGLAEVLRDKGAEDITLFTTHSDHEKGINNILDSPLIDRVITTDSKNPYVSKKNLHIFPVHVG